MSTNSVNNHMRTKLMPHRGHAISCVCYGDWNDPQDVCIECESCGQVLISAEDFDGTPDCEEARLWQQLTIAQMQLQEANNLLVDAVACLKGVPGCLLNDGKRTQIEEYLAKAENYEPPAHIHPSNAKRPDRLPAPRVVIHVERGCATPYSNIPGLDITILDMDTTDPDARAELDAAEEEFWAMVNSGSLHEEANSLE